jgi:hypothetical protein
VAAGHKFLISNFRCVLNILYFLFCDSPASEVYLPTFPNTLFQLLRLVEEFIDYRSVRVTDKFDGIVL